MELFSFVLHSLPLRGRAGGCHAVTGGWGGGSRDGTQQVAQTLSLEPCDNILELRSKNQDFHYRVIYVTPCINLFGANVADILLQIVIDRLRT